MEVNKSAKAYFESLKESGLDYLYAEPVKPEITGLSIEDAQKKLDALKKKVLKCEKCVLHKTKKNYVFGEGSPRARLVIIGEAPGADEDKQGRPFIGRAGQLLTKMIEAINLTREDVFICNILKCRPPENRDPLPDEVAQCDDYLYKQLEILQPKIICALGKHAVQTLLQTDVAISKLRGHWQNFHGIKFMPTWHPAYLLRNQSAKKGSWEDLKKVRDSYFSDD
jgi:uracil-DNA glycosylase